MEKAALPIREGCKSSGKGSGNGSGGSSVVREHLVELLQRHFGHSSFRGRQLEAIEAVMSGKDCFCLMPTGGGKSMCYEIPALAKAGVVLVVSPLIALMENQVSALKAQKIAAEYLCSTQTAAIKAKIYEQLDSGRPKLRLLYVTPELIATSGFISKLKKLHGRGLLNLIAIDEAHCISSWGHDFRKNEMGLVLLFGPSYRKLSNLRTHLPGIPILALTATAAKKVQEDVVKSLGLDRPLIFISSFNRPNIYYEVRYKDLLKNAYEDLRNLIKSAPEECCIIYCHSRATCDDIGARLLQDKISSRVYHAGLENKARSQALEDWASGKVPVVVATVAFGMGIDRKDVRMVCHFNVPKSLEGFYQESGRAGRDGKSARSIIYYGLEDRNLMEFLARKPEPKQKNQDRREVEDTVKKNMEAISKMVQFCEEARCRRQAVLAHFGERVSVELCAKTCDACRFQSRVAACIEDMALVSTAKREARFSSYITSSKVGGGFENRSEFWDEVEEESEDDISESDEDDDEASVEARTVVSKQRGSSHILVEKKVDALLRAEQAFSAKQGEQQTRKDATSDRRTITQASRDTAVERLKGAVLHATQRLHLTGLAAGTVSTVLESECFRKYGKAGKPFYNSQVASTVRWLSTCSSSELESRVPKGESSPQVAVASSSGCQPAELRESDDAHPTPRAGTDGNSSDSIARESVETKAAISMAKEQVETSKPPLPAIPSFKDFMGRKKPLPLSSFSSKGPSAPFKKPRRLQD